MTQPMWAGDTGTLSYHSRRALVQLLKGPMIRAESHPQVWKAITTDEDALRVNLHNLFLDLVLDEEAGVAFARAAADGQKVEVDGRLEPMPKVLRTESLSHMDTLLILHLRQELALAAPGERVIIDRAELRDQVLLYRTDAESDEATLAKRYEASFRRMVDYSLLYTTETEGRHEVSPALRQIFDAATVEGVRAEYERFRAAEEEAEKEETEKEA